ncbi:MAG: hypothetical protein WC776_05020 [Patescibacteria group bacterium]|jgi:hypothetical protein
MYQPIPGLTLSRVERVTKVYDKQGREVEATWEYWYPNKPDLKVVGFSKK